MSEFEKHIIRFEANEIQRAFILSRAEADLWAARMGEGKSAGLCWACFYHTEKNPTARWAFIRDTWENLRDTTQKEFFEWFPPGECGEYLANAKTYRWRIGEMRGEVQWLGMDDEKDAAKLQSRPLGAFAMDEPAPAAESGGISEFIFTTAMSRLRQKGMKWYAAKLAENSPDESHWTFRRFNENHELDGVELDLPADQERGFRLWRSKAPENQKNLPVGYYERLAENFRDRPDLVARFVRGDFGFQRQGRPVTPAWNDSFHLAEGLKPVPGVPLHLLWDFGHTPTCVVTQITPLGHWQFLDSLVGVDVGVIEHIDQAVRPLLQQRYQGFDYDHTVDPAGFAREQTSHERSPVRAIREKLGGSIYPGAVTIGDRVDPLNAVLSQSRNHTGLVQVDRHRSREVWMALRGGWHYPVRAAGVVGDKPVKNQHSHPGDSCGYGAGRLYPVGRLRERKSRGIKAAQGVGYFRRRRVHLPKEGLTLDNVQGGGGP